MEKIFEIPRVYEVCKIIVNHNFKNNDILKYPSIKKKTLICKWSWFKYNNYYWRWPTLLHIIESDPDQLDKNYKAEISISYNIKGFKPQIYESWTTSSKGHIGPYVAV